MVVANHLPGTVDDRRALSSSSDAESRCFIAAFRLDRAQLARCCWQLVGLAWLTVAILVFPIVQGRREREALHVINQVGGRCHIYDSALVRLVPRSVRPWFGLDRLHSIRTINFSRCKVSDADLEKLTCLRSLRQVNLCGCSGVTTRAVARLRAMPQMRLVWVDGMSVEDASRCLMGAERPNGVLAHIVAVLDR